MTSFSDMSKNLKADNRLKILAGSILRISQNITYTLRPIGNPIKILTYWDDKTKKSLIVKDEQEKQSLHNSGMNMYEKFAFWVRNHNYSNYTILEVTPSVFKQITNAATNLGVFNPGDYNNGIKFEIERIGSGLQTTFNISNASVNNLSVQEISEASELEDLRYLYFNIENNSNKITFSQFEIKCSVCNGNGYTEFNNEAKVCSDCQGNGVIRY